MSTPINRRNLIGGAAVAGAGACLLGTGVSPTGAAETAVSAKTARKKMSRDWPRWNETDEEALLDVLNSGKWGRTGGGRMVPKFEAVFA